jgi:hypothetical protein
MARFRRMRRFYGRARTSYRRRGGARGIAGISLPWVGGAALGYLAPTIHPLQEVAMTVIAVAPIRLPYGIQNIAKGYVLGRVARNVLPGLLGSGSNAIASSAGGDFI